MRHLAPTVGFASILGVALGLLSVAAALSGFLNGSITPEETIIIQAAGTALIVTSGILLLFVTLVVANAEDGR